ncbi:tfiif-interacting component of the c-terminal domain phosphatase [Stylonychia lemnae]|uniref:protein-serine/threonine phosphatase n=1 Tax=Stylonychia lemnae TaxID=5949 RepID=A0A078B093_STYLE|nr:tfiif-interacting component of the c-terminal domain phosphatase [Stylonychia lemnae]|eukprot:CDW87741.1 tfiif-interacting component of the c-terminal domain phosphatase [Stylonychia lemnae]
MDFLDELMENHEQKKKQIIKPASGTSVASDRAAKQTTSTLICETHIELYQGICTKCGHILSQKEMSQYRQFALLNHQTVQVHRAVGQSQVEEKKKHIMRDRKLVLVLDLDNTLIHTRDVQKQDLKIKSKDNGYIALIDQYKCIYEIKQPFGGFHVKLRPFLAEFLKIIHDQQKFDIFYYTAGTRAYGQLIIDVFKMEISRAYGQEMTRKMEQLLTHKKLISRCDQSRFQNKNQGEMTVEELQQQLHEEIEQQAQGIGGDSTLNIKHFIKSLSSLAGGDESIFIIIDDRSDVWTEVVQDPHSNQKFKRVSQNLLLIPGYFYWETSQNRLKSYFKVIQQTSVQFDFDLSLLLHLKFIEKVHDQFYEQIDNGLEATVKTIIRQLRKNLFDKKITALFEILYNDSTMSKSKILQQYEGDLCNQFGLNIGEYMNGDREQTYLYIVDDFVKSQSKQSKIDSINSSDYDDLSISIVSIYWLYLSCHYYYQLPIKPFIKLKQSSEVSEQRRIFDLISLSLECIDEGMFNDYKKRYKEYQEHKEQQIQLKKRTLEERKENNDLQDDAIIKDKDDVIEEIKQDILNNNNDEIGKSGNIVDQNEI